MLYPENIVYESDLRQAIYFSVIQHETGVKLYRNYFNLHKGKFLYTHYYALRGNSFHKAQANMIHEGNCLSHNFSVFTGHDGKIYGIGGMDNWKHNITWHKAGTFDVFKTLFKQKYGREYDRGEARFKKAHDRLINEKWLLDYSGGLYLFTSDDGINFKPVQKKPIITVNHPGYNSALDWKSTEFDSHICCIHDGHKYILYVRDNIKKGIRYIQYATSKDLVNWSEFNNIVMSPKFDPDEDNYYLPCFHFINNKYLGFLPYFRGGRACIRYVRSVDGIKWTVIDSFFLSDTNRIIANEKNPVHPVQGHTRDKKNLYFYFHMNYWGADENEPVVIKKYRMAVEDLR